MRYPAKRRRGGPDGQLRPFDHGSRVDNTDHPPETRVPHEAAIAECTAVERVAHGGLELAIILRACYRQEGIRFFTPSDYSQQLGYMRRPAGYRIAPHVHVPVPRAVTLTSEVQIVRSGRVRVDFYDKDRLYIESRVVAAGDVVLLASGGHGFEMLEPSELIEVKQGPYIGEADKARFEPVAPERLKLPG